VTGLAEQRASFEITSGVLKYKSAYKQEIASSTACALSGDLLHVAGQVEQHRASFQITSANPAVPLTTPCPDYPANDFLIDLPDLPLPSIRTTTDADCACPA
jgi:hypothetical protein